MKAVLFDFDGALVDSDEAQILSFNHVLAPHDQALSEADYAGIAGWSNDAIFSTLFPDSAREFRSDEVAARRADILAAFTSRIERGIAEGDVKPGADAGRLARYNQAVVQGMSVRAEDGASEAELTDIARFASAEVARHAAAH